MEQKQNTLKNVNNCLLALVNNCIKTELNCTKSILQLSLFREIQSFGKLYSKINCIKIEMTKERQCN